MGAMIGMVNFSVIFFCDFFDLMKFSTSKFFAMKNICILVEFRIEIIRFDTKIFIVFPL